MKLNRTFLPLLVAAIGFVFPAAAQQPSFADLVEKLQPSVVNISTRHAPEDDEGSADLPGVESTHPGLQEFFNPAEPKTQSLGSGFIIAEDGYIITNRHVIDKAENITVTLADNRQFEAKLIGSDDKTDIALIKIAAEDKLPAVVLGDSDKIRVGDWIIAIGNPFGLGGSVTAGIVSAKSRDIEAGPYDNFIQTDASINQGSSGGPMFNLQGEVIGINSAIFSTNGGSMGIGFAVPINLSRFVIEQLKSKGFVERGWLGLKIQPGTADMAQSLGLEDNQGVMVAQVSENSPAAKAGIEPGDMVLKFAGQPIDNTKNLSRMAAETPIGQSVTLEIWRQRQILRKTAIIEKMPEPEKPAAEAPASVTPKDPELIAGLEIKVADIEASLLDKYQLPADSSGVIVTAVAENSDAALKGLKPGDLLIQIDKKNIFDRNDLVTYVEEARRENNRPVLLLVKENEVLHFAAVKLRKDE